MRKYPFKFHIQNRGKGALLLYDVAASCTDCTTILSSPNKLEPGEKGVIEARILTAELHGDVDRTLSIYSNDVVKSRTILHITAHVWSPLEMKPNYIYFPVAKAVDSRKEYRVEITNTTDKDIHLSNASSDNLKFRAKLVPCSFHTPTAARWKRPMCVFVCFFQGLITFNTSYVGLPTIQISAIAKVSLPLTFSPSRLYLKAGDLKKPITKQFKLSINSEESVEILDHSLNIAGPTIKVTEKNPGEYVKYAIYFPEGFTVEPDLNASLTVRTTHGQFGQLNLPIRAYSNASVRSKD